MSLKVQYLRGVRPHSSECWSFVPLSDDVNDAIIEARDVQSSAQEYWGAKSYRIVDDDGRILTNGRIDAFEVPPREDF
jgi:hypothetical protein